MSEEKKNIAEYKAKVVENYNSIRLALEGMYTAIEVCFPHEEIFHSIALDNLKALNSSLNELLLIFPYYIENEEEMELEFKEN